MISLALLLLSMAPPDAEAEAISLRAVELAQQKRFEEAERLWKEALRIMPKLFSAAFNLGYMYQSRGDYAEAEPYLKQAAESNPKDFNARYLLGLAYSRLGRPDDALKSWRSALTLRPSEVKLMKVIAVEYEKARYFREAAGVADRALAITSTDPELHLIAIKAHQDANEHSDALNIAQRLVRAFPDLPRANFEYAYELNRAGQPSAALPFLTKAIEADARYDEPLFLYGEILSHESKWKEAAIAFRRGLDVRRDYIPARIGLSRALISQGLYDEAQAELLRAVQIDSQHPQPHLLLSQLYFRLGKEDLALREKQLSLDLRKKRPETMEGQQERIYQGK